MLQMIYVFFLVCLHIPIIGVQVHMINRLNSACSGFYLQFELPIMATIPENTAGVSVGHVLRSIRDKKVWMEGQHLGLYIMSLV